MNPVDIKYLLEAITKSGYKLRGKEIGIIKSMNYCITEGLYASTGQAKFLNDIYAKSAGSGDYQNRERI